MPPMLRTLAAVICAGPLLGASSSGAGWRLEAPDLWMQRNVMYAGSGFVLEMPPQEPNGKAWGTWLDRGALILGDGLRWDRDREVVYVVGPCTVALDGLWIRAESLGANLQREEAEAWNVDIEIERDDGVLTRMHARRLHLTPREARLEGVVMDSGHGGFLGMRAGLIVVRLQPPDQPNLHRQGLERHLRDATIHQPVVSAGGVPIVWLPALWRDWSYDWPWTQYRFGSSRRQGVYARWALAARLKTGEDSWVRPLFRADWHDRAGWGFGSGLTAKIGDYGRASYDYYGIDEKQRDPDTNSPLFTRRYQESHDAAWRGGLWGNGELALRYVTLPDPDLGLAPGDERLRGDYRTEDLEQRSLARRAVTALWSNTWGSLRLEHQALPHNRMPGTERERAAELSLHGITLPGDVLISADVAQEDLRRQRWLSSNDTVETQAAERLHGQARLGWQQWFGPVDVDLGGSLKGLGYREIEHYNDSTHDNTFSWFPQADASLALPVVARFAHDWQHRLLPEITWEWSGLAHGDEVPDLNFADGGDAFLPDQRTLTTALGNTLSRGGLRFYLDASATWALREEDRVSGTVQGKDALLRYTLGAGGQWPAGVRLQLDAVRDAVQERWTTLNGDLALGPSERQVRVAVNLVEETDGSFTQSWRPGLSLQLQRYRIEAEAELREEGDRIDAWSIELLRNTIDGTMSLRFAEDHDTDGNLTDQRIEFTFILRGFGPF